MPVRVGLRDLYYALVLSDDSDATVYDTPKKIAPAVSATITPTVNSETFYADDGPYDETSSLGGIELSISSSEVPLEIQAELLGHTIDATTGVMIKKSSAVPPWVAVGFRSLKSNGKYRYVWLLKGKFREPEESYETKGESVTYQPSTLVGTFVKRESDDAWQYVIDEDSENFNQEVALNWFNQVEPSIGNGD